MPDERHGNAQWWQQDVIYQIYPRSFQDTNGDGVGDLRGISERLEYLAWLGVGAIWISPFYPSPMADFGYDISDYTGVDPLFGTLADFDALLEQAHRRGIKVILDFVPNHTSDQHPWFQASRSRRDDPKRDWYVWADPRPDGSPPNNWLSVFGGRAWEWDAVTGQYYLHSFLEEQPDLNWRNPAVREAMYDVLRFWLERGVDGFRLDAVHFVMKDPAMRDNPPNDGSRRMHRSMGDYDTQLHLHDKGHPDVHGVFREIRAVLEAYSATSPRMSVGETHVFDWAEWASYYGQNLDELHMPFNFGLLSLPWDAAAVRGLVGSIEAVVPPGAWPNYVLGNHDEPRIASRIGPAAARVAMMLLLTLRGTPTLYYGDELGMGNALVPPERVQDPWEKLSPGLGLGRDPGRTPMPWSAAPNAGFCPPGVSPWLPVGEDHARLSVSAQREQPGSMLTLTRELLALRKATPALLSGGYTPVDAGAESCFVFERHAGRQRLVVALNFSPHEQSLTLPGAAGGRVLLSTHLDRREPLAAGTLRLRADEGCVLELP